MSARSKMAKFSFADILAPLSEKEFFSEILWAKTSVYSRQSPEIFAYSAVGWVE